MSQHNKNIRNYFSLITLGLCSVIFSPQSFASSLWSNYFSFSNNFNVPMTLSISPTLSTVTNLCGGDINNIEVAPHSKSCKFQFDTTPPHWYSITPENNGTITLALKDDPNSFCTYNYSYAYTIIPYSYFDIRSEIITLQTCQGKLKSQEISVINPHNQALPRPLDGNVIINVDKNLAAQSTESFSEADCGVTGGDNCMIASPDLNTNYLTNGSTLAQAVNLQTRLDRFEPLNFEQFIGVHNAAISRYYTNSTSDYNLSYADPDNYLSLTDQLNSGVRQIELDIQWYNNNVTICHNHVSPVLQGILCDGNVPIRNALTEIKTWVEKNPDAFIFIYLDVNLPLSGHVNDLDSSLALLEPYVFTPAMAQQYYKVTGNTLPALQLSQNDLITQFKKNIIVTNDNDVDNLKASQYAFVAVENSSSTPLTEESIHTILHSSLASCSNANKYNDVKNIFNDDPDHVNLYRTNGDRTVINFINSVDNEDPDHYIDYMTTLNIPNLLNCPLNIFSTNMFGFTCDDNHCNYHPTDPRIASFLWSWNLGYPLQSGGSNLAYINPKNNHFENSAINTNNLYSVLCLHKPNLSGPTAPLSWYLQNIKINDVSTAADQAQLACANSGGIFAVPTTSYWMHDALSVINPNGNLNPYQVLVNYQHIDNDWIPNHLQTTNENTKLGNSLIHPT